MINSSTVYKWCGNYCDKVQHVENSWQYDSAGSFDFTGTTNHVFIVPGAFKALTNLRNMSLTHMGIQELKNSTFEGHCH